MGGKLHLVKYLYVDDDGNLVARAWDGVGSVGIPMCILGKPGGVAKLDGNGHIDLGEITPILPEMDHLPPPGPDYEGKLVRVKLPSEETPSGKKTELYVCVPNSQDQDEWVELSEST